MKIVMIIPFRADSDGFRKRNLLSVLAYYNQKFETIVVEQSSRPVFPPDNRIFWSSSCVSLCDDGPFNRAICLNQGARMYPDFDWLIFSDGDVIHPNLFARIPTDTNTPIFISPKNRIMDMTEEQTQKFIATEYFPYQDKIQRFRNYVTDGSALCILNKKAFELSGGWDERFEGWGGEDEAFSVVCRKHPGISFIQTNDTLYHLEHPYIKETKDFNPELHAKNVALRDLAQKDTARYMKERGLPWM